MWFVQLANCMFTNILELSYDQKSKIVTCVISISSTGSPSNKIATLSGTFEAFCQQFNTENKRNTIINVYHRNSSSSKSF